MNHVYTPYTVQAWKDGVCLFETDCELRIDYCLPDGRRGPIDWDVMEFHFEGIARHLKTKAYTKITRAEPLFGVLYQGLDRESIEETLRDMLADSGTIERYGEL